MVLHRTHLLVLGFILGEYPHEWNQEHSRCVQCIASLPMFVRSGIRLARSAPRDNPSQTTSPKLRSKTSKTLRKLRKTSQGKGTQVSPSVWKTLFFFFFLSFLFFFFHFFNSTPQHRTHTHTHSTQCHVGSSWHTGLFTSR